LAIRETTGARAFCEERKVTRHHQSLAHPVSSRSIRRVVLVVSELRLGGMERVVVHLAQALSDRGVRAMVCCLQRKGPLGASLSATGVPVAALESMRGYDVACVIRLGQALRRFDPDVINIHDLTSLPYTLLASRWFCRRPLVFTAHGALYTGGFKKHRFFHRLASRGLAAMTAVSEEAGERHCEYFGWRRGFDLICNGVPDMPVNLGLGRQVRHELGIGDGTFVFLGAGNVRPEKGFEDLLEAAAQLREASAESRFVVLIAGLPVDESYSRNLLQKRAELGLTSLVRFLGLRDDMHALYSAADAFVLSSRAEGLPMVVLESMMAGLGVIGTRVGAVSGVLSDGAGLLVDPASPDQLAARMCELMSDGILRKRLVRIAREKALADYSVQKMAGTYLETFCRMARSSRKLGSDHRRRCGPRYL
jgi:glycosyltransferase involved in cell wall biosynthesis